MADFKCTHRPNQKTKETNETRGIEDENQINKHSNAETTKYKIYNTYL